MLINSISGIRGTIGGAPEDNLTPPDIVNFASAYGSFLHEQYDGEINVVLGRDARASGEVISQLVSQTLRAMGINVIDLGLVPTPTVEMFVIKQQAQGGIIITASHNPKEYNGLKMLNHEGEFLSAQEGESILIYVKSKNYNFADVDSFGNYHFEDQAITYHINKIFELDLIDKELIRSKKFTIVVDAINSVGGIAVPQLLEQLDIVYVPLYCAPDGQFAHPPEPLEKNLEDLKNKVRETGADLGIAVDPDVDRLVLVSEDGSMFGEEYTLVACADYILSKTPESVVTNLSSSRALEDLAQQYNVECHKSAVGEKNVVTKMKEVAAVIGGEGSGGIIYPKLHHGRDALAGIALVLNLLADRGISMTELRSSYSSYYMAKEKVKLDKINPKQVIASLREKYKEERIDTTDGLKIDFKNSWIHLRKSNTEPIMRIYTEARTQQEAQSLAQRFISEISAYN